MATLNVKLFGPQARLAETRELAVTITDHPVTAAQLLAAIASACPPLSNSIAASKLAVNHEVADPADTVTPDDEIALIGMLGGG